MHPILQNMNLENIIYVAGKPGLYQIISKGKNMIVGESLIDKKRTPLHLNNQTTVLKDIGIYTYNETKPLEDIFKIIANKEQYKEITNIQMTRANPPLVAEFFILLPGLFPNNQHHDGIHYAH